MASIIGGPLAARELPPSPFFAWVMGSKESRISGGALRRNCNEYNDFHRLLNGTSGLPRQLLSYGGDSSLVRQRAHGPVVRVESKPRQVPLLDSL